MLFFSVLEYLNLFLLLPTPLEQVVHQIIEEKSKILLNLKSL